MLHAIRRKGSSDRAHGPAEMLLECHERMRRLLAIAARLARAMHAPASEVAEAAASLHRYFEQALPLHEQDEELSVAPRLLALEGTGALSAALSAMAAHHTRTHAILAELLPLWERVGRAPRALDELHASLDAHTLALSSLLGEHLSMEEVNIFPMIDRLPEGTRAQIVIEMRRRRGHE